MLGSYPEARRESGWPVLLRRAHHWCVLPSFVSGAPTASQECPILRVSGTGGEGRASRLSPLPALGGGGRRSEYGSGPQALPLHGYARRGADRLEESGQAGGTEHISSAAQL